MPPAGPTLQLSDDLATFLERGVSVMVGTRSAECVPELMRAWGPRISADRRSISVCVAKAGSATLLANLQDNGHVAVTFALPLNSNAVQVWGRSVATAAANGQDLSAVDAHRDAFARMNESLGVPRPFIEALWRRELAGSPAMVRIRFVAEQIFNQTPGPGAGSPL